MELSLRRDLKLEPEIAAGRTTFAQHSRIHSADLLITGAALIAFFVKLAIAYNTIGTNDTVAFYGFAKVLNEHGLEWAYQHSRYFNHPPLIAYYLRGIYILTEQGWCQDIGLHFPFLLRLPGIIADFLVVLVLVRMTRTGLRVPTWALALFALSPVSLMVSGFHGNTDSVMVFPLICAAWMCLQNRPVVSGLFFALSCQVKIVPLLFLPIFFFFWMSRRHAVSFSLPLVSALLALWAEPLLNFPTLFARNVLFYGSYWGIWGIPYWLRLTNLGTFRMMITFYDLTPVETFVVSTLKVIIIAAVLIIAWRRRNLGERALLDSLAYAWIAFFVFAPAVCAQYMVWLAPFVLVLSPVFYGWLAVSSSLFLFFFYNVNAGEFPWYGVISDGRHGDWAPWSLWPWATLILGMILLWKKAVAADPSLRFVSLQTLRAPAHE
jgi:glycosyl transferase family 87